MAQCLISLTRIFRGPCHVYLPRQNFRQLPFTIRGPYISGPAVIGYVNNTAVRLEFVFNSNDSLKTKITNTEINKYELKLK